MFERLRRATRTVPVVLYTRQGCTLCDEMEQEMEAADCDGNYQLQRVDIDTDRSLKKRFGLRIPVLAIDGEVMFEGRLDPGAFRNQIRRASRRPQERD